MSLEQLRLKTFHAYLRRCSNRFHTLHQVEASQAWLRWRELRWFKES